MNASRKLHASPAAMAFPKLTTAQIFESLDPPTPFVEHLGLFVGAPTIFGGPGYSGKTLCAMTLALAIAAECNAWGLLSCVQGRVLHVDDEQGEHVTRERYQRALRGHALDLARLGDRLHLIVRPPLRLDDRDAKAAYARELQGYDLAILDSLRSLAPKLDENKSEFRGVLDALGEISERSGCRILLIHHARKPSENARGGARASLRGTGAIFDAAAACFFFTAEKGRPVRVSHEKDRVRGVLGDDLVITIEDVATEEDARWGVRVRATRVTATDAAPDVVVAERIVAFLESRGPASKSEIAVAVPHARQTVLRTVDRLEQQKVLTQVNRKFVLRSEVTSTPTEEEKS